MLRAAAAALRRHSRPPLRALSSSTPPPPPPSAAEAALEAKLRAALPGATTVVVRDASGGCGTMYAIDVAAAEFRGVTTVKAHKMVTGALKDDVPAWHGFHLTTKAA